MKTNELVQIILEALAPGNDPWYNPYTAYSEADRAKLQAELQKAFPFVNVSRSTLGGENKASLLITVSADKRETWHNNILENSRYAKFHLSDRKVECISGGRIAQGWSKMRKSVVRDVSHAATKIIAWSPAGQPDANGVIHEGSAPTGGYAKAARAMKATATRKRIGAMTSDEKDARVKKAIDAMKNGGKKLTESDFPGLGLAAGIASGVGQVGDMIKRKLGIKTQSEKDADARWKAAVEAAAKSKARLDKKIAASGLSPEAYNKAKLAKKQATEDAWRKMSKEREAAFKASQGKK